MLLFKYGFNRKFERLCESFLQRSVCVQLAAKLFRFKTFIVYGILELKINMYSLMLILLLSNTSYVVCTSSTAVYYIQYIAIACQLYGNTIKLGTKARCHVHTISKFLSLIS